MQPRDIARSALELLAAGALILAPACAPIAATSYVPRDPRLEQVSEHLHTFIQYNTDGPERVLISASDGCNLVEELDGVSFPLEIGPLGRPTYAFGFRVTEGSEARFVVRTRSGTMRGFTVNEVSGYENLYAFPVQPSRHATVSCTSYP